MTQLNRYASRSNSNNQKSFRRRWTSPFRETGGTVIAVLDRGYLPQNHNDLPKPFCSFKVESDTGKRSIVRLEGRQAIDFTAEVGQYLSFGGVFKSKCVDRYGFHGEYWSASFAKVESDTEDAAYVAHLTAVKLRMDKEAQDEAGQK